MKKMLSLLIEKRAAHFLIVGFAAFAVEYGSFYLLYQYLSTSVIFANTASFIFGLTTSFVLNRVWTFSTGDYSKQTTRQFTIYVILAAINLFLTNVIVLLLKAVNVDPRIGKLAAMILTSAWNFFLYRSIIFSHKHEQDTSTRSSE